MLSDRLLKVLKSLGMAYNDELGTFVHRRTQIPLSIYYDPKEGEVRAIDQTKLPYELSIWKTRDWKDVVLAIKQMIIRGAPLIGCAGGFALPLAARKLRERKPNKLVEELSDVAQRVASVRPTAVDVENITKRIVNTARQALADGLSSQAIAEKVEYEAIDVFVDNLILNKALRDRGREFIQDGDVVLTHCNPGSLATSYGGSALGIIEEAVAGGSNVLVVVKETRPRCQGYKLTTWELLMAKVPMVVISDNMVSSAIDRYNVTKVLVGADRITRDGYVANKIGTHDIALIASSYQIPFYVAAPYSTLDFLRKGAQIPIEERDRSELTKFYRHESLFMKGSDLLSVDALENWPEEAKLTEKDRPSRGEIRIYNPAFDVTPPNLISQVILDVGTYSPNQLGTLDENAVKEEAKKIVDSYLASLGVL